MFMSFDSVLERAERSQLEEDERILGVEEAKLGEGANTSAHLSPRGYVVKPVSYDWQSEDPFEQAETARGIDRFPWVEIAERDVDGPFNYALVKMSPSDLSHKEAVEVLGVEDVVSEDLDMFFDLRQQGVTYSDFKPENIGYFWEDESLLAKPIDLIDSYAWSEEQELPYREFSDILDVYIRGTPNEEGLVDLYPVSAEKAEEQVMDYLGIESQTVTGDPYKDFFQVFEESQEQLEDVLSY